MKLKPQIYAKMLLSAVEERGNLNQTAKNFWFLLQKNKQYKDLGSILESLDQEVAARSNKVLVKAYSAMPLKEDETQEILEKIKKKYGKDAIIKNVIRSGLDAGIVIKIDDREIDLSLRGKISRLQKILIKDTLE